MRFANDAPTRLHFVDGLRGLAVLSVVGFHVHIPHMGGGFTGVDMFFVISGFVITIQLIRNLEAGTFSFWKFYYQRFLRIIPPLVVVCLCTILLAPCFPFLPKELARLDYTAVAALTMVVNYYLAGKNGYFETSSQDNPLLHTWSLGVEEQYYAFAPAILVLVFLDTAASYANVRAIDATDVMCGAERCVPFDGGAPLYSDNFHLTIAGAEKFTQGFAADLAWAFGDAKAAGSGEAAPANQEFGR